MQLINALVTQPDELDLRLHLRNEIIRCGLKPEFIEVLNMNRASIVMFDFNKLQLDFSYFYVFLKGAS